MNFLENYKTAFALKRLDYLQSVFDDNAVIISGCTVNPGGNRFADSNVRYAKNQYVRYTRESKRSIWHAWRAASQARNSSTSASPTMW